MMMLEISLFLDFPESQEFRDHCSHRAHEADPYDPSHLTFTLLLSYQAPLCIPPYSDCVVGAFSSIP